MLNPLIKYGIGSLAAGLSLFCGSLAMRAPAPAEAAETRLVLADAGSALCRAGEAVPGSLCGCLKTELSAIAQDFDAPARELADLVHAARSAARASVETDLSAYFASVDALQTRHEIDPVIMSQKITAMNGAFSVCEQNT